MVDLGGYIIILTNDDGKIKLYGKYEYARDSRRRGRVKFDDAFARYSTSLSLALLRKLAFNKVIT